MRWQPFVFVTAVAALTTAGAFLSPSMRRGDCPTGTCRATGAPMSVDANGQPEISVIHLANGGKVAVCFAPGTTPAQMRSGMERIQKRVAKHAKSQEFFIGGAWSANRGAPIRLGWSFAPEGIDADGAPNILFSTLDTQFETAGGREAWVPLFESVFTQFEEMTAISYDREAVEEDADDGADWGTEGSIGSRGDVRIAMNDIDGPGRVLAYNYYPGNGIGGDMLIDSSERWGGNLANFWRFFRNVIAHEHGHGIGLAHTCPVERRKLMEPFLATNFDTLQHDDLRGAQTLYGDDFEPNDNPFSPWQLGDLDVDSTTNLGIPPAPVTGPEVANLSTLSIERSGKPDYFAFSLDRGARVRVTVTPIGTSFLNGPQNSNGSCQPGTAIDTLKTADLSVELLGPSLTRIGTATSNPAGTPDIATVDLPTAGRYTLKVSSLNSHNEAQMYRLQIEVISVNLVGGTITIDGVPVDRYDGAPLTLEALTPGTTTVLETVNTTLDKSRRYVGTFGLAPGTYDITIRGLTTLKRRFRNVVLGTGPTLNAFLINGDANGDNRVSTTDFAFVTSRLGINSTLPAWDPRADMDRDLDVTRFDPNVVRWSLNRRGE